MVIQFAAHNTRPIVPRPDSLGQISYATLT